MAYGNIMTKDILPKAVKKGWYEMEMKKMEYTREMIEAIYDEMDRRIELDIANGCFKWEREIVEARKTMLQGIYSAMTITASNWLELAWTISEIESERYAK